VGKGFNQDYWARFEKFAKDLTKQADAVYIVTGPMFTPTLDPAGGLKMEYKLIGSFPETVAVPTHYFKVVLAERREGGTAVGAFVLPNAPIDPKTPLLAYAMPVEIVESVTGIRFFPDVLSDGRRQALDTAAQGACGSESVQGAAALFWHPDVRAVQAGASSARRSRQRWRRTACRSSLTRTLPAMGPSCLQARCRPSKRSPAQQ